jgi:hypothetical protein
MTAKLLQAKPIGALKNLILTNNGVVYGILVPRALLTRSATRALAKSIFRTGIWLASLTPDIVFLPCLYGIRLWIWPEPLVAPRRKKGSGYENGFTALRIRGKFEYFCSRLQSWESTQLKLLQPNFAFMKFIRNKIVIPQRERSVLNLAIFKSSPGSNSDARVPTKFSFLTKRRSKTQQIKAPGDEAGPLNYK